MSGRREFIRLAGGLALLPGCAALAPSPDGPAAYFDAGTGRRLGWHDLLDRLASAPILLLGEVHDNAAHHRIRAAILQDWVGRRPSRPAAVVFEQLDREFDAALRLAQRGYGAGRHGVGERHATPELEQLLDVAHFDRRAWGWPAHRPVFEAALASGATWIAANFSRASARRLAAASSAGSTESARPEAAVDPTLQAVVESARWSEATQATLEQALMQGHCNALPAAAVSAIARAQRLRDAALALPLLDANERRPVLIAGNGHVRRDHGVPRYLGAYEYEALVVGFEEVDWPGGSGSDGAIAARADVLAAAYDLVCFTPAPGQREDPCAAFSPAALTRTPSR